MIIHIYSVMIFVQDLSHVHGQGEYTTVNNFYLHTEEETNKSRHDI